VVATDEDKLPILELRLEVVVATELDRLDVVVATDELKPPIEELRSEVVIAIEPDKLPTLEEADDVYELNDPVWVNCVLSKPSKVSAFNAYDAVDATPVIVPKIVPLTHRSPVIVADPVIYGELILIYLKYFYINTFR
jgi:hypothetical protein